MRSDRERLEDILAAVDKILLKTAGGAAPFVADPMVQVWVLYHLQVIGEAVRTLSETFRREHPDRTWAKAVGLRNILVHQYFEIKPEEIWKIVERDLPALRAKVCSLLKTGNA